MYDGYDVSLNIWRVDIILTNSLLFCLLSTLLCLLCLLVVLLILHDLIIILEHILESHVDCKQQQNICQ